MMIVKTNRIEHNNATICAGCELDAKVHYLLEADRLKFGKISASLCSYCMRSLRDAINRELR